MIIDFEYLPDVRPQSGLSAGFQDHRSPDHNVYGWTDEIWAGLLRGTLFNFREIVHSTSRGEYTGLDPKH